MLSVNTFKSESNASEIINLIEKEGNENGFNLHQIYHVFGTLNNIDENFELIDRSIFNKSQKLAKKINTEYQRALVLNQKLQLYYDSEEPGRKPKCNTYSCILCSPAYETCDGDCEIQQKGCGIFGLQNCDRRCYNTYY